MGQQLRTIAARRPGRVLAALAAVAFICAVLAGNGIERLALDGSDDSRPALTIHLHGAQPARSPAYRVVVRTMRAQLSADPAVTAVRKRPVAGDPRATNLAVRLGVAGSERDSAVSRIERNLDPGPLKVTFSGQTAVLREARDATIDDLDLLLLAAPFALLILAAALGARTGGATILAAAAASAVACLTCELLGGPFDISLLALIGAGAGGTLVALQLCALARAGAPTAALAAAGLAAGAVFGCLGLLGVGFVGSAGLGGALGSLLAVPASLVAIGAVEGWDPPLDERPPGADRGAGPWRRLQALVGWSRPVAIAVAALTTVALLVFALPATRLQPLALGSPGAPAIGAGSLAAAVASALAATALLAWSISRRPLLAVAASSAAALPGLAVAGVLVLSFQDGRFEALLDYQTGDALHLGSVATALAAVSALAAAQAVSLGWAALPPPARPGGGQAMETFGPAAAIACAIGIAAGAALVASELLYMKQFGLALAAGLLLELLLVQGLLAPALVRLLGRHGSQ